MIPWFEHMVFKKVVLIDGAVMGISYVENETLFELAGRIGHESQAALQDMSQKGIDAIASTRADIDAENNQPTALPNGEKAVHTYSN
nr:hypothetical protein [Tanacetum cinerariifolium]